MDNRPPKDAPNTLKSVMITCPKTGRPVATGRATGTKTNLNHLAPGSVQCPHCGAIHEWTGQDIFLGD